MSRIASALILAIAVQTVSAQAETITFEQSGASGAVPSGFTQATTGRGVQADWKLQEVAGAPSGKMVVQQFSAGGDMRFPILSYDKVSAADVDLSVKFQGDCRQGTIKVPA